MSEIWITGREKRDYFIPVLGVCDFLWGEFSSLLLEIPSTFTTLIAHEIHRDVEQKRFRGWPGYL